MGRDEEQNIFRHMLEFEQSLHIFYFIAAFLAFLGFCYWLSSPQVLYGGSLRVHQFETMSADEYVALMRRTTLVTVPDQVEGWPVREDIPYLLSLADSRNYAGSAVSEHTNTWFQTLPYESTEGITAVILLKAIKEGVFHPYMTAEYPPDKDEIIAWARAEAEKMNAEQALKPR
jgi:hypothetical protein